MASLLFCLAVAAGAQVYPLALEATASSDAGGVYAAASAVDGNRDTRWASARKAPLPQWIEVRLKEPAEVDTVLLTPAADDLYGDWKEVELGFASGDPVLLSLDPCAQVAPLRFPPRKTDRVRIAIRSVHTERQYVGLYEIQVARDPEGTLSAAVAAATPVAQAAVVARGRKGHPCVNITPADIQAARDRIERFAWARVERDQILAEAEAWLRESDAYWLAMTPPPGACYAYGRTGCPICGGSFGTWDNARCSWDRPRQAECAKGHVLPNADYPDDGTGFKAKDGRTHFIVGVWNAWATEQWTRHALPALAQAYLLTGDERYAERATLLLDALASIYRESTSGSWDYPSSPPSGRLCRPWYQVARTLVPYADHYDWLYSSPSMDKPSARKSQGNEPQWTRRTNIEQNLLLDGAYYCYAHTFSGALHNGHADYMRGALAVGCALDVPVYVKNSLTSPFSIYTMLANNIDRDGTYYETSFSYAVHARLLYLTFADPLFNLRSEEYPNGVNLYDDPRLQAAILLPDLQAMMAGRAPNCGDCGPETKHLQAPARPFSEVDYGFLERLYARASDPRERQAFGSALEWLTQGDLEGQRARAQSRNWLLWHGAPPPEATPGLSREIEARVNGSWVAGVKGIAFLRAGDQAALLRYGPSLTHGDPDDLGLLYYAKGYELSYDIGYGFGSTHVSAGWASQTVSHCLVTVDETSQRVGEVPTSGGSLLYFADLPGAKVVSADSKRSYASRGVSVYRRTTALVNAGGYLVDLFEATGGRQHDYGWGSIGTDLDPFGVTNIVGHPGSLAEGVDWGRHILPEGDIEGYPDKPYWSPPPGNGYGFFYDVRTATASDHWGGCWAIAGEVPARFRAHLIGDPAQAIFADGPGIYPKNSAAGFILARRKAQGEGPLESAFLAVYEPFTTEPILADVRRLGRVAVEVTRDDGAVDVVLLGECQVDSAYGALVFKGGFAFLTGDGNSLRHGELAGCARLELAGKTLFEGPGCFEAHLVDVDLTARAVALDATPPDGLENSVAVFSNPRWAVTSPYHILGKEGNRLVLQAGTLVIGKGRYAALAAPNTLASDVPHMYLGPAGTGFVDGKRIRGEGGGETRVVTTQPGTPLKVVVDDASALRLGEAFEYLDLSPGDSVRIPLLNGLDF